MKPEELKTEGPYYLVKEGTNICDRIVVSKDTYVPKIFDTKEIAQTAIDERVEYRKSIGLKPPEKRVLISVKEYNRKYAKIMGIKEEDN